MPESIRQRIGEGRDTDDYVLREEWIDGNLIPADEHKAAVSLPAAIDTVIKKVERCVQFSTGYLDDEAWLTTLEGLKILRTEAEKEAPTRETETKP